MHSHPPWLCAPLSCAGSLVGSFLRFSLLDSLRLFVEVLLGSFLRKASLEVQFAASESAPVLSARSNNSASGYYMLNWEFSSFSTLETFIYCFLLPVLLWEDRNLIPTPIICMDVAYMFSLWKPTG